MLLYLDGVDETQSKSQVTEPLSLSSYTGAQRFAQNAPLTPALFRGEKEEGVPVARGTLSPCGKGWPRSRRVRGVPHLSRADIRWLA
jgi:hypothetical protein